MSEPIEASTPTNASDSLSTAVETNQGHEPQTLPIPYETFLSAVAIGDPLPPRGQVFATHAEFMGSLSVAQHCRLMAGMQRLGLKSTHQYWKKWHSPRDV